MTALPRTSDNHAPQHARSPLDAFFSSALLVTLAEFGDKTQLLSFALAARLRRPMTILAGIAVATLANHTLAALAGGWLAQAVPPQVLRWLIALSFFAFGAWALRPDRLSGSVRERQNAFTTTLVAFFIAEMGDKTQLATVALAARYEALVAVTLGTTLGMLLANAPAVWLGERLAERVPMHAMRRGAAALFVLTGILALLPGA